MPNNRLNKAVAGYHILMILAAVDFRMSAKEDLVIRDYIVHEFPFRLEMDREIQILSTLRPDEWEPHFLKCMDDFYDDALEDERAKMLQFSIDLCKADDVISKGENRYLDLLFDAWYHEPEA